MVNPAGSPHQTQESSDQISTADDASEDVGRGKVGGRTCEVNESSKILMLGKAFEAVAPLVLTAATIAACTSWFLTARSKYPSPAPPHSGRDILEKTFFATAMLGLSGMMLELEQAPSRLVKKVSQTLFAIAPIVPPATFAGLTINRLLQGSCAPPWISEDDTALGIAWYVSGALSIGGVCAVGICEHLCSLCKMITAPSNNNLTSPHPDGTDENTPVNLHEKQS